MKGGRRVDAPSIVEKKFRFSPQMIKKEIIFSTHLEIFQLEVVINDGDGWGGHP